MLQHVFIANRILRASLPESGTVGGVHHAHCTNRNTEERDVLHILCFAGHVPDGVHFSSRRPSRLFVPCLGKVASAEGIRHSSRGQRCAPRGSIDKDIVHGS